MKKKASSQLRPFLQLSIFLLTIFIFSWFATPKAHAQPVDVCDYSNIDRILRLRFKTAIYCGLKNFVTDTIDITTTVIDIAIEGITGVPLAVVLHTNADDLGICSMYWLYEWMQSRNMASICPNEGEATIPYAMVELAHEQGEGRCDFNETAFPGRSAGSVAGITSVAFQSVSTQSAPVNLAYYTKHNMQKIPVIKNTAFAQTSPVDYNAFGLGLILGIWETSRNIAYAMMSIIMLIIGIMITTRKRISAHAVVTAQMAIPRVVISLLLITFSYPIGAILASAVLPLSWATIRIFFSEFFNEVGTIFANEPGQLFNINLLVLIIGVITVVVGSGGIAVVVGILLGLLTIVALFVAFVKLMLINIKILIQIIIAPIQFAIAAIPGQEHLISDWFKQMIAKVLAIPAIIFMTVLAWYLLARPFIDINFLTDFVCVPQSFTVATSLFSYARGGISLVWSLIALPIMAIMVMFVGLGADKKIEEFILGGKRGGKR